MSSTDTIDTNTSPSNEPISMIDSLSTRKRSRLLFGANHVPSQARFAVPHCGYTISDQLAHKSVVARRVRLFYPVIPADSSFKVGAGKDGEELEKDKSTFAAQSPYSYSTSQVLAELKRERLNALTGRQITQSSEEATRSQLLITNETRISENQLVSFPSADSISRFSSKKEASMALVAGQKIVPALSSIQTHTTANSTSLPSTAVPSISKSKSSHGILSLQVQQESASSSSTIPIPQWHAPWKLSTVISSHLGWVRCIAIDPTNDMFCTGSADRTIKVFDLAKACVGAPDALKLTLTGHISALRGLGFSSRHPYLFSAGEDKMIKCWDLETNQVVRHYHGHLSGIYSLKLHPTLDLLVTGGRDSVARVWDIRTKFEVACLSGHENTVGAILTKSTDPQIITGSYDSTIKLWDLAAGKCMSTLTHHKKSIRALAQPTYENTFISGAADILKKWQGKDGKLIQNFNHQNMKSRAVVNAVAISDDGVVVSAADDGSMNFWDYSTGYCFQQTMTTQQPGSLDAENGIYCAEFDLTGTRIITGEADKSIKIWKQDEKVSEIDYPVDIEGWRKHCIAEKKRRY